MKKKVFTAFIMLPFLLTAQAGFAEVADDVLNVGEVNVSSPRYKDQNVIVTPTKTIINVEDYADPGSPQTILDLLESIPGIDVQRETDLVPARDSVRLRGFTGSRFIVAIDGLPVRKTGGRKSSNIVDYNLLTLGNVERIEIMRGPHYADYPSDALGGVINIITKKPKVRTTLKPQVKLDTGYRSYNTQNYQAVADGGVGAFNYGLAIQQNSTDGYLRNSKYDSSSVSARLGYVLPHEGTVNLILRYADSYEQLPVANDPKRRDYDGDYPVVTGSSVYDYTSSGYKNEIERESYSTEIYYKQPTSVGLWDLGLFYSKADQYMSRVEEKIQRRVTVASPSQNGLTAWDQFGGKVQDEIELSKGHVFTLGYDWVAMYDEAETAGVVTQDRLLRSRRNAGYAKYQWDIVPSLKLTLGMRYEAVDVTVTNSVAAGYGNKVPREWSQWIPKAHLQYEINKETMLVLGVSRIWHPPTNHGDYNPQGSPSGIVLDPEHGIGYDVNITRTFNDKAILQLGYFYYDIKDYISSNSAASKNDWDIYSVNLNRIYREGVECQLTVKPLDTLNIDASYTYQDFGIKQSKYRDTQAYGDLYLTPQHKAVYSINWKPFTGLGLENTSILFKHTYVGNRKSSGGNKMDYYNLLDLAVAQGFFDNKLTAKVFINNLTDEVYEEQYGYPMTDRTFGVSASYTF